MMALPAKFATYRHILALSGPLILSQTGVMLMQLVDALFLSRYSQDALAAVGPAGMSAWVLIGLCIGVAGYTTTFVAQYLGAGRPQRVGSAVWQGIYVALVSGTLLAGVSLLAGPLFAWVGHAPSVARLEIIYFRIFCWGAVFFLLAGALSGFFSGRHDNRVLAAAQIAGALVNVALDYAMIFGHWGFPAWGVAGAAWATVISQILITLILGGLFLQRRHRYAFATWQGRRVDWPLFKRLLRFGFPNGLRNIVEILAWTVFLMFVGRVGQAELAATNIVWRLNGVAFFPLIGLSIAVATLVGQAQGASRPDLAERSAWRGLVLGEIWMLLAALAFVLFPRLLVNQFHDAQAITTAEFEPTLRMGVVLLRFVAIYCLMDGINIILMGALQGAGDTRWTLVVSGIGHLLFLLLLAMLDYMDAGLYPFWTVATAFVLLFATIWFFRFRGGQWKDMRVIEYAPAPIP